MDNAYYLTHPRVGKTAVVYAPTTEKARTTFLDWLERNNFIRRANRHFFRKDMIAERIEDPNVPSDVILNYGYKDFTGRFEPPRPGVHDIPVKGRYRELLIGEGEDVVPGEFKEVKEEIEPEPSFEDYAAMEEMGHPFTLDKSKLKPQGGMMPIQQVMLRGYLE